MQISTSAEVVVKVQQKLKEKDDSLPTAALEKIDSTVIAEQHEKLEQKVGVYKINLRKDHDVKVGASHIDNKLYWAAGYRNRKIEYTVMGDGHVVKGCMIQYTIAEWYICHPVKGGSFLLEE